MKQQNGHVINKLKKYIIFAILLVSTAIAYQKNSNQNNYKPRKMSEYNQALKILWTKVYPGKSNTLYCDKEFTTEDYWQRKKYVNAEHIYPMSWVAKSLGCGTRQECRENSDRFRQIESDLHNIYPALIDINRARSSFKFGDVKGEKREFGSSCDFEVDRRQHIAEPRPAVRGEIARAMLYMEYQYGLKLHRRTKLLMLKWNRQDPPSEEEKRRERIINQEQGRENPFITRYPFNSEKYR